MIAHVASEPVLVPASDGAVSLQNANRFLSVDGGFTADLPVDADGLVVDYPELFKRRSCLSHDFQATR